MLPEPDEALEELLLDACQLIATGALVVEVLALVLTTTLALRGLKLPRTLTLPYNLGINFDFRSPAMQTFSIRDLRDRSGELTREAEEGRLCLVTKHGQPLFVTLPFTDEVMEHGARFGLALQLYKNHDVSLGKAAQIAQMPYADFLFRVGRLGIPVVDYSVEDFKQELATLEQLGYL